MAENNDVGTRTSGAAQGNPTGTATTRATDPASADTDGFLGAHVSANRCLKGALVALRGAAAELNQLTQGVGERFYDFARTRLGLAPAMADFYRRLAKSVGLDAAQFSPAVEVKLAKLMAALGTVVAIYNDTVAVDDMPTASTATPAGNGPKTVGDAVGAAAADAGAAVPVDAAGRVAGDHAVDQPQAALTAQQRQFLVERSLKLLVQVNKGEVTPEAAMRQAEKLPVKGKKCVTGSRHTGAESAK